MYNNQINANCLQSVPEKEFRKSVNNWQRYGQEQSATFFIGPRCMCRITITCHHLLI